RCRTRWGISWLVSEEGLLEGEDPPPPDQPLRGEDRANREDRAVAGDVGNLEGFVGRVDLERVAARHPAGSNRGDRVVAVGVRLAQQGLQGERRARRRVELAAVVPLHDRPVEPVPAAEPAAEVAGGGEEDLPADREIRRGE